MKKLKTNGLFWVILIPLLVFAGCHPAHDTRYDTKKSLPGWGVYQEHPNFPINGYYYIDIKDPEHNESDLILSFENDRIPIYAIKLFYSNGIVRSLWCKAESLQQLDYNVENNIDTAYVNYGSYQISNDSLFTYDIRVCFPKKGKAPKFIYQILINKELYPVGFYSGMDKIPIKHFTDSVSRFRPLKHKPDSTNELMKDTFLQGQMRKGYEEYINRKK
jgi:hypothetical protein